MPRAEGLKMHLHQTSLTVSSKWLQQLVQASMLCLIDVTSLLGRLESRVCSRTSGFLPSRYSPLWVVLSMAVSFQSIQVWKYMLIEDPRQSRNVWPNFEHDLLFQHCASQLDPEPDSAGILDRVRIQSPSVPYHQRRSVD